MSPRPSARRVGRGGRRRTGADLALLRPRARRGHGAAAGGRACWRRCARSSPTAPRPDAGGRTPSDFPLARLDQAGVDRLVGRRARHRGRLSADPAPGGHALPPPGGRPDDVYLDQATLRWPGWPTRGRSPWPGSGWSTARRCCAAGRVGGRAPSRAVRAAAGPTVPVVHVDWRGCRRSGSRRAATGSGNEDLALGLDLGDAAADAADPRPAARRRRCELLWTSHHLILDGWSLAQVFDRGVRGVRRARRGGPPGAARPPALPRLLALAGRPGRPRRPRSTGGRCSRGSPPRRRCPATARPCESHRAAVLDGRGGGLSAEVLGGAAETARRSGLTLNTVVQGAWALLLSRYSGEQRRGVRHHRLRPPGGAARGRVHGGHVHQHPAHPGTGRRARDRRRVAAGTPGRPRPSPRRFESVSLAQLSAWQRGPGRDAALRQHGGVRELPLRRLPARGAGLRILDVPSPRTRPTSRWSLRAHHATGSASTSATTRTLFDAGTAEALADRLCLLLTEIAADPDRPLRDLPWLTRRGAAADPGGAGTAPRSGPPERTVVDLFEEQAARTPDAIAVTCGADVAVLRRTRRAGGPVGPPARRRGRGAGAVCGAGPAALARHDRGDRGRAETGAAYLPIDPDQPAGRIAHMLADTEPVLLLTTGALDGRIAADTAVPRLCLDDPDVAADLRNRPATAPDAARPLPDSPAYVIYTSGSTGPPKGVVVDARQRGPAVRATDAWFAFGAGRRLDALPLLRLRLLRLGDLGAAAPRRPARRRPVRGQRARPEEFLRAARGRAGDGAQPDAVGVLRADACGPGTRRRPARAAPGDLRR